MNPIPIDLDELERKAKAAITLGCDLDAIFAHTAANAPPVTLALVAIAQRVREWEAACARLDAFDEDGDVMSPASIAAGGTVITAYERVRDAMKAVR